MGLFSKPDFEKLKQSGDAAAILKASRSLRPSVKFGALQAMLDLADPALAPALIDAYVNEYFLGDHRPLREAIEVYLPVAVPDLVVAEADKRMGDVPGGLPELVRKIDSDAARAFLTKVAKREAVHKLCEVPKGSSVERVPISIRLKLVVSASSGNSFVYLTPSAAKWPDSEIVNLPEACTLCGCFKGSKWGTARGGFQARSGASILVGMSASATAVIEYPLCKLCTFHDEKAPAIVIESVDRGTDGRFTVNLQVLNPEVAASIRGLNQPA
jgi:hypothetical protein